MTRLMLTTAAAALIAGPALAEGELHIYNWGNYTNPELIEKFEAEYGIEVTITDYDSNDTALAKIEAGGSGFDIVVPSASYIPIYVEKGLILDGAPRSDGKLQACRRALGRRTHRPGIRAGTIRAVAVGHGRDRRRHLGL